MNTYIHFRKKYLQQKKNTVVYSVDPTTYDMTVETGVYMKKNDENRMLKIPQQDWREDYGKM